MPKKLINEIRIKAVTSITDNEGTPTEFIDGDVVYYVPPAGSPDTEGLYKCAAATSASKTIGDAFTVAGALKLKHNTPGTAQNDFDVIFQNSLTNENAANVVVTPGSGRLTIQYNRPNTTLGDLKTALDANGTISADGDGVADSAGIDIAPATHVLVGATNASFQIASIGGTFNSLVEDTSPQLGGDLDICNGSGQTFAFKDLSLIHI